MLSVDCWVLGRVEGVGCRAAYLSGVNQERIAAGITAMPGTLLPWGEQPRHSPCFVTLAHACSVTRDGLFDASDEGGEGATQGTPAEPCSAWRALEKTTSGTRGWAQRSPYGPDVFAPILRRP